MSKYKQPNYESNEFTCPYCKKTTNHDSIVFEKQVYSTAKNNNENYINQIYYKSLLDLRIGSIFLYIKICNNCGGRTYWEAIWEVPKECDLENVDPEYIRFILNDSDKKVTLIYPNLSFLIDIEPNTNMTDEEKNLFNQAKNTFYESPKSAGALLRTILESILKRSFNISDERMNLGDILKMPKVNKNLDKLTLSICNTCRLIGNSAAHSEKLNYQSDDKDEVELFFKLINMITDKIIIQPLKEKELLGEFKNN